MLRLRRSAGNIDAVARGCTTKIVDFGTLRLDQEIISGVVGHPQRFVGVGQTLVDRRRQLAHTVSLQEEVKRVLPKTWAPLNLRIPWTCLSDTYARCDITDVAGPARGFPRGWIQGEGPGRRG